MKARLIELKVLPGNPDADEPQINYRTLLLGQVNRIDPKVGLSVTEIEKRLEMRKSLKEAGDTWIVNDETWNHVKYLLATEMWAIISENLMQMIRDVNNAPEAEVTAKSELSLT